MQGAVAMACTKPDSLLQLDDPQGIMIWSFAMLMHPEATLESPVEVACFDFSRSVPGLVAGGCVTGQIIMWHDRKVHRKNFTCG